MFIQSSDIRITSRPRRPTATLIAGFKAFYELDRPMEAVGTVTFSGRQGEKSAAGWTVGFLQAQWSDTNWGLYRGLRRDDGSVFIQRSRPPARPVQACFDTTGPHQTFYGSPVINQARRPIGGGAVVPFVAPVPPGAALPMEVSALHSDQPITNFETQRRNGATGRINLLREAQWEMSFCTVLVARDPQGRTHMLRGFYWNIACWATFPVDAAKINWPTLVPGTHATVGRTFEGPPTDPRFLSVLARPQPTTCNDLLERAYHAPNVQEATGWPNFDVRR